MNRRERVIIAEAMKKFLQDRNLYTRESLVCLLGQNAETQRNVLNIVATDIIAGSMEYLGCDREEIMEEAKGLLLLQLLDFLEDSLPCVWGHNNYYGGV